jgi:hypothetical protein
MSTVPAAQFSAVMRAPVVRIIEDVPVTFPTLTSGELAELGEIVRAEWWDLAQKNPRGAKFTDLQWFRVRQEIDEAVIPATEIMRRVGTLPGAEWCIRRGLRKASWDDGSIQNLIDAISPQDQVALAEYVSRIRFMQKVKSDTDDKVNRPLTEGGDLQPPPPIGEPSASTSGSSESTPPS